MKTHELVLAALCVWRITHLFQAEDGPWDLVLRLRRVAGEGFFGQLLDCFYCLSLWIAVPFAWGLGGSWRERLLLWPSLSATAILLERLTGPRAAAPPPALYVEDKEVPSCPVVDSGGRSSSAPTTRAGLPSAISSVTSGRRL